MSSTFDPMVGQVLDSRYEIVAKVARGGMATVYRARDLRLSRTVALKVMRSDLGDDDEFVAKFDREARSAAVLSHTNIVSIFDQGIAQGQPYIVMEYVDGETLRRVISREAPLRPEQALQYMEAIASALAAAHDAGVVHRDIKPENVLISHRGQLKVVDFGLARRIGSPQMTATGVLVGTASYLPPELVTHSRPDSRSDIYSAGVLLFELLTGTKPHTGENNYQIAYRHVNVDIQRPSERLTDLGRNPGWPIPDYVDALVQAATTRDPEKRVPDGQTLLNLVRKALHQLQSSGYANNPSLASEFAPEPSGGAITQQINISTKRPRPLSGKQRKRGQTGSWQPERRAGSTVSPAPAPAKKAVLPTKPTERPATQRTPIFHISNHPTHRRRRGALALILVLAITAVASIGSWWWMSGRYTTVPAMVNQNEATIRAAADAAQLNLETSSEYSEDVPAGLVIRTDPAVGDRVLRDATVIAVVSLGPERFSMPTVVGLDLDAAKAALAEQNLSPGEIVEAWHEEVPAGQVLAAQFDPETPLKRDTSVKLTVSKGRQPITIPDFTGQNADKAEEELKKAGFKVRVDRENHSSVEKDLVISQDPDSGSGNKGDRITLVRSLGPVIVEIPDVRYKSRAVAEKMLRDAGLTWEVQRSSDFPLPLDIAAGTSPSAGEKVPEGTKIILHIT